MQSGYCLFCKPAAMKRTLYVDLMYYNPKFSVYINKNHKINLAS